ncbi:hypothetical protein HDU85_007212 [Gaertneriomyces sp. JEL0708]|nr:hypothetical protein BC832DRAFT_588496 [Gaertneriomyces semiglobifer]KAJ3187174.1 hypothetical protein HDU85_007212 [Gaertneriomyces sp. JEL0708]
MATILKQLYGHHPSFLKLSSKRSLFELIAHLPNSGKGLKVAPSEWTGKSGCFWTIDECLVEDVTKGKITGRLTMNATRSGKSKEIPNAHKKSWHFYAAPEETTRLEGKLGIPESAPTN